MSANAMSDNDELQQIAHLRREYTKGGLRRQDLPAEPLVLFERWLKQACEAKLADPTAMVVATVDENGQPYQRIVLLKHYDEKGLVFYTNLGSRKAHHLKTIRVSACCSRGTCWNVRSW
jgi:pyridoxamine 5'-phosphate oxidase